MPRATLRGVSRAPKTGQPGASCPPQPPWHGENEYFTCLGAWQAPIATPGTSPGNAVAAPAPKDGTRVGTRKCGRGAKEDPACCLLGKCPQGQGCPGGKTLSTRRSAILLEDFPRVMVPRREEEVGCRNPQSACKPPRITNVRGVRREPGLPAPR